MSKTNLLTLMVITLVTSLSTVQAATTYYSVGYGYNNFNSLSTDFGITGGGWASTSGNFDIYSNAQNALQSNGYLTDYTDLVYTYNLGYISGNKDLTVYAYYFSVFDWESVGDGSPYVDFLGVNMEVRLYKGSTLQSYMSNTWSPELDASDPDYIFENDYSLQLSKYTGSWTLSTGYTYYLKITITYWTWAEVNNYWESHGYINDNYHAGIVQLTGSIKDSSSGGCIYWNGNWYC